VNTLSAMLAAGGTGGHLFPALALAQELGRRGIPVDLVTDMRGDRYGRGFPARQIYHVPSATLTQRSPFALLSTACTLARGIHTAIKLLDKVKPAAVVGFGGYPSVPPLFAARLRGIPTALHEQNAVLGRANRLLAKGVNVIATSFDKPQLLNRAAKAKARVTGNPVRRAVIDYSVRPYTADEPSRPISLLIFGGSQGARFFSDTVPVALALLPPDINGRLEVVQQCRQEDIDRVRQAYARCGIVAELATFFPNLPELMAAAQLVIARAGASTVAELAVLGRPSILVPLPHALDNDQHHNAMRLAESGAAWCIEQRELTPERLAREIERLCRSPSELVQAAAAARALGRPAAAQHLADLVEELIRRRGKAA
jgi:UDP-N-acetylglucosamine--N-acetylmuramyl-(pentapeptide) pyrophosphoryl-undecaprenol N-acetylglucosamine transferase